MEKVEVPFLTYTAVPYRVFVLPDKRAVAAIVVAEDGTYFVMSRFVEKAVGDVILSIPLIDRKQTKELVFRVGNSAVSAIGYRIVADSNYKVDLVTEVIRYIISEGITTHVKVIYAKGNREVLPKLTPAEERLLELVPEEIPEEVIESIEAIEIPLGQEAPKQEKEKKKEEEKREEAEETEELEELEEELDEEEDEI